MNVTQLRQLVTETLGDSLEMDVNKMKKPELLKLLSK